MFVTVQHVVADTLNQISEALALIDTSTQRQEIDEEADGLFIFRGRTVCDWYTNQKVATPRPPRQQELVGSEQPT
jgi:hypothetical protein